MRTVLLVQRSAVLGGSAHGGFLSADGRREYVTFEFDGPITSHCLMGEGDQVKKVFYDHLKVG